MTIKITPELSAQGFSFPPNPRVSDCLQYVEDNIEDSSRAGDQGCGRLRNLHTMVSYHDYILLIDTKRQFEHQQLIDGNRVSIPKYVENWNRDAKECELDSIVAGNFIKSNYELDVLYSIATYDVVPEETRHELANSAAQNLKTGGYYFIVAPRNDSSILKRCGKENAFQDGHVFSRNGDNTFFCNFREVDSLTELVIDKGFRLIDDLSLYRQVLLVFEKT